MQEIPKRWVIYEADSEFARPVQIPESQVPQEGVTTLMEGHDLQPLQGTTTFRDKGESTQVEQ